MLSSNSTEDIFIEFQRLVLINVISVQHQDYSPIISLGDKLLNGDQMTQNQANYIIKLLEKYKNLSLVAGLDYKQHLTNPQWKQPFRVLDLSKKIYVEKTDQGKIEICMKFPFQLKKVFEEQIETPISSNPFNAPSRWDADSKVRRLNLYQNNLVSLYEFVVAHGFEIDNTFLEALSEVEEIWQNSEDLIPQAISVDGVNIHLANASEETTNYFQEHCTGSFLNDALLAKSMGYPLNSASGPYSKLVTSLPSSFWVKHNKDFFKIYQQISGNVCIILDRASNILGWLEQFVKDADESNINRDDIKVCFRENKVESKGLNDWIKSAGVGGKVDSGRIFIFETKPAKWLFKDPNDVKIVVTNTLYPSTNQLTRDLISSHPCVFYLGDIKATAARGQTIVEL